jgi:choloylglycine hydrolase
MQRTSLSLLVALSWSLVVNASQVSACTDVVLNKTNGVVVSGRTLDYDAEIGSNICFRAKGSQRTDGNVAFTAGGFEPLAWTSKYDSVLIDAFNLPAYCDGMNSEGLSAACLWQNETEPAKAVSADTKGLSNVTLVEYVVENAKNVDEAKALISNLSLFLSKFQGTEMVLHWIVTDKTGKSIVVELKEGRPQFFDQVSDIGVLTNSPTYDKQLANVKAQSEARPKDHPAYNLPGDYRPISRFVKAAYLVETTPTLKSADQAVTTAMQILHNVEVPKGAQDTGSYTQWMAIRDQANLRYYLVSSSQPTSPKIVDLRKIDFKQASAKRVPIDGSTTTTDVAQLLNSQASASPQN